MKNGVICLVIMFTPQIIVIKMLKLDHFLYFLLMEAKKLVTVWTKYLRATYLALQENVMDYWMLSYH